MPLAKQHKITIHAFLEGEKILTCSYFDPDSLTAKCSCGWEWEENEIEILAHAIQTHKINVITARTGLEFT